MLPNSTTASTIYDKDYVLSFDPSMESASCTTCNKYNVADEDDLSFQSFDFETSRIIKVKRQDTNGIWSSFRVQYCNWDKCVKSTLIKNCSLTALRIKFVHDKTKCKEQIDVHIFVMCSQSNIF